MHSLLSWASLISLLLFTHSTFAHPTPEPLPNAGADAVDFSALQGMYNDYSPLSSLLPRSVPSSPANTKLTRRQQQTALLLPTQGTIHMSSSLHHQVPLEFSYSSNTCAPLASETNCLLADLAHHLLAAHSAYIPFAAEPGCHAAPSTTMIETVRTKMGEKEYRATVRVKISAAEKGVAGMRVDEWRGLVGLLEKTANAIWMDGGNVGSGFGMLGVKGTLERVNVDAEWVFYEIVNGVAGLCLD